MRINERERIIGEKCVLVPYCAHHVPKYHQWMQDEELRQQTASEPLTLEEEYAMQKNWHEDEDKLTFIILDRAEYERAEGREREVEAMAGDVNIFIRNGGEEEKSLEITVMVAEKRLRGKGLASEACSLMIEYVQERLHHLQDHHQSFIAVIDEDNAASLALFQTKLHFQKQKHDPIFKCFTLHRRAAMEGSGGQKKAFTLSNYDEHHSC